MLLGAAAISAAGPAPPANPAVSPPGVASGGTASAAAAPDVAAQLERRIGRLHSVLRITPDQEAAWNGLAQAMRRNAGRSAAAEGAWRQRGRNADAVQDLRFYGDIEAADAANARDLLSPFQALYGSLSPAQRRTADALVVRYIDAQTRRRP
ncbi:MAG: Spy/CpxP family protein refolding chaperone [Gluconacetobacter diazotrophicus]|nr:Spy/CpxP family protein refolding chaperone [Gluconacetobacter diazotrophicus]